MFLVTNLVNRMKFRRIDVFSVWHTKTSCTAMVIRMKRIVICILSFPWRCRKYRHDLFLDILRIYRMASHDELWRCLTNNFKSLHAYFYLNRQNISLTDRNIRGKRRKTIFNIYQWDSFFSDHVWQKRTYGLYRKKTRRRKRRKYERGLVFFPFPTLSRILTDDNKQIISQIFFSHHSVESK